MHHFIIWFVLSCLTTSPLLASTSETILFEGSLQQSPEQDITGRTVEYSLKSAYAGLAIDHVIKTIKTAGRTPSPPRSISESNKIEALTAHRMFQELRVRPTQVILKNDEDIEVFVEGLDQTNTWQRLAPHEFNLYLRTKELGHYEPLTQKLTGLAVGTSELIVTQNELIAFVPMIVYTPLRKNEIANANNQPQKMIQNVAVPSARPKLITLSGLVFDAAHRDPVGRPKPLANIHVKLVGTNFDTRSDASGIFVFRDVPENSTFEIELIDFNGNYVRYRNLLTVKNDMPMLRYPMLSSSNLETYKEIAGIEPDASGGTVCGKIASGEGLSAAGVSIYASSDQHHPLYNGEFGFPNRHLDMTSIEGTFCFYNLDPGLTVFSAFRGDTLIGSASRHVYEDMMTDIEVDDFITQSFTTAIHLLNDEPVPLEGIAMEVVGQNQIQRSNRDGTLHFTKPSSPNNLTTLMIDDRELEPTILTFNPALLPPDSDIFIPFTLNLRGTLEKIYSANPSIVPFFDDSGIIHVHIDPSNNNHQFYRIEATESAPGHRMITPHYFVSQPRFDDDASFLLTTDPEQSSHRGDILFIAVRPGEYQFSKFDDMQLIDNQIVRVLGSNFSVVSF